MRGPSLLIALLVALLAACGDPTPPVPPPAPVVRQLSGPSEGFARAFAPRPFEFPADHGPHPAFRTEWWYLTGNLTGPAGERYGFQITFFRVALTPEPVERPSAWGARDIYMGHFALTDAAAGRFRAHERFARGAAGLAGAQAEPFAVWLEDWRLEQAEGEGFRLTAAAEGSRLDLLLRPRKPVVLQGDRGLSQKSGEPGNASYYYSLPRLAAEGSLSRDGSALPVTGSAWFDREWSSSALGSDQAGWEWFALQLDDGRELMYYRLRRQEGSVDPHSAGSWIEADGSVRPLAADDLLLTPLKWWQSPRGGRYPVAWRLELPAAGRCLRVDPLLEDQELALTVRYWEGAVQVTGCDGTPAGRGYLEMTGYAEAAGAGRR